jgi:hypothetical protein
MMHNRFTIKLLTVVGLLITLTVGGLPSAKVDAQGGVRLRQPFNGTRRLTAYVDHRSPNYTQDGNVVVYTGEERLNCPDCGEAWTDQGPFGNGHALSPSL